MMTLTSRPPPTVLLLGTDGAVPDRLPLSRLVADGFQIADRRDDPDGIHIARALKPDVIVMDVVRGNPLALELGRQLQTDPDTQRIPLIAVTGDSGAAQFMVTLRVRQCDATTLHAEIQRVLEQRVDTT